MSTLHHVSAIYTTLKITLGLDILGLCSKEVSKQISPTKKGHTLLWFLKLEGVLKIMSLIS